MTRSDTSRRERGERPRPVASTTVCPVCGGEAIQIKCKTVCGRCRSLIENCSGD